MLPFWENIGFPFNIASLKHPAVFLYLFRIYAIKVLLEVPRFFSQKFVLQGQKNNQNTFWVAEGLVIMVQQCYTTLWKRLDVSFSCFTHGDKNVLFSSFRIVNPI